MKYLIVSDIHGRVECFKQVKYLFNKLNCDQLIVLGDLYYNGARNDVPSDYNPKELVPLLNEFKGKITAVRGNCDSEVDLMVSEFPIAQSKYIVINNKYNVYLHHGHKNLPILASESKHYPLHLIFEGHYHVKYILSTQTGIEVGNKNPDNYSVVLNPGSVSLNRDKERSLIFIDDDSNLFFYSLGDEIEDCNVIAKYTIDELISMCKEGKLESK